MLKVNITMTQNSFKENIFLITQSLIALIVVAGGGIFIFTGSDDKEIVVGIMGVVIGYYFSVVTSSNRVSNSITPSVAPDVK